MDLVFDAAGNLVSGDLAAPPSPRAARPPKRRIVTLVPPPAAPPTDPAGDLLADLQASIRQLEAERDAAVAARVAAERLTAEACAARAKFAAAHARAEIARLRCQFSYDCDSPWQPDYPSPVPSL